MLKDKRVDDFLDQITYPPKAKPISSSQKTQNTWSGRFPGKLRAHYGMAVFGQRTERCPGDIWITIRNKSLYLKGCKQGDWVFVGFFVLFLFFCTI